MYTLDRSLAKLHQYCPHLPSPLYLASFLWPFLVELPFHHSSETLVARWPRPWGLLFPQLQGHQLSSMPLSFPPGSLGPLLTQVLSYPTSLISSPVPILALCWFPHCTHLPLCLPELTINSTKLGTGPHSEGSQHSASTGHIVGV